LFVQLTEQQSVFAEHDEPGCEHIAAFAKHVCIVGSHMFEQQSPSAVQPSPKVWHGWLASGPLPLCL
jgi:hypothetical protein